MKSFLLASKPNSGKDTSYWLIASMPMLLFLAIPLVALVSTTNSQNIIKNLSSPQASSAIALSLRTSFAATMLAVAFGTPVAYVLARKRFFLRNVADALLDIPILLPPAVAGIALLVAFGREGIIGKPLGISLPFTTAAVVVAQLFVASPFFLRSAVIGFSRGDTEMEEAAELDGASSWQVFALLHLPLAWTALASGAVMTWARALGEFGATLIFAGNFPGRTQTMPLAIYLGFEIDFAVAAALSVAMLFLSFILLIVVRALLSRGQIT